MSKMPQGLPTPANSTDIQGKDGPHSMQMSFELPPPAITASTSGVDSRPTSASAKSSSASSYHPSGSPKSPVRTSSTASKRRQSNTQSAKDAQFALPPPPTRSRKIIQMKPRQHSESVAPVVEAPAIVPTKATPEKGKKKQPSSTSVAGRKIARKTAHSLIERRRRSKMNEEFGVLKDMIPACTGEMHKLAILQASIDYIRYLEDCVSQLKAQNQDQPNNRTPTPSTNLSRPSSTRPPFTFDNSNAASYSNSAVANQDDDEDEDIEMEDSVEEEAISPTQTTYSFHKPYAQDRSFSHSTSQSHQPPISPAILSQDHHSYPSSHQKQTPSSHSSTPKTLNTNVHPSPDKSRGYSYSSTTARSPRSASITTSPNFGPQSSPFIYPSSSTPYNQSPQIYATSNNHNTSEYTYIRSMSIASSGVHSQLTSPALMPVRQGDVEREQENAAMAALMMLNSDRRGAAGDGGESAGRERGNLSVRDLLSH